MPLIDELKSLLLTTLIRELQSNGEVDPRILSTAAKVVKDFADELERLDDADDEAKRETLKRFLDRRKADREADK